MRARSEGVARAMEELDAGDNVEGGGEQEDEGEPKDWLAAAFGVGEDDFA